MSIKNRIEFKHGKEVVNATTTYRLQPATRYTCFFSGTFDVAATATLEAANHANNLFIPFAESDGTALQAFEFVTPPSGLVRWNYDGLADNEVMVFEYAKITP